MAKLVAHRRTLLVLDGLEPLQNPPEEGRLRELSLQALLRELAAFNKGTSANNFGINGPRLGTGVEGQRLTSEDQLFILTQAALYLTVTRGSTAPEVRICYERAESLCHSLNHPLVLYVALVGQWRYSLGTAKLTTTMQIAKRIYSLAQEPVSGRRGRRAHRHVCGL